MMAKAGRSRAPAPMVVKGDHGLSPMGPFDQEELDRARIGQIYDLTPRTKRSHPQLRLYWLVLGKIVEATGAWATSAHLHEVLVRRCGFVTPVLDPFTGEYREERDSIAFDAMNAEEANAYVTTAFAALSAWIGVDVLELLPPSRRVAR